MSHRQSICAFFLLVLSLPWSLVAQASDVSLQDRPHTQVQGNAEVLVEPDHAVLRLALQHFSITRVDARTRNQAALAKLIDEGVELGIVRADFASTPSMVFPGRWQCAECPDSDKKTGYTAHATLTVTLRRLDALMDLVAAVTGDEAVLLQDVEYRTSALREHRDRARALAIKAAREKAVAFAAEIDQRIGKALSIVEEHESGDGFWSWSQWGYSCCGYYSHRGSYGAQSMSQNVVLEAAPGASAAEGAMAPGRIAVRARVNAMFELL